MHHAKWLYACAWKALSLPYWERAPPVGQAIPPGCLSTESGVLQSEDLLFLDPANSSSSCRDGIFTHFVVQLPEACKAAPAKPPLPGLLPNVNAGYGI